MIGYLIFTFLYFQNLSSMNSIKSESYSFLVSRKNIMISDNYIQYVYDITIAYGGEHIVESEMELLKSGIFPEVFLLKMTI